MVGITKNYLKVCILQKFYNPRCFCQITTIWRSEISKLLIEPMEKLVRCYPRFTGTRHLPPFSANTEFPLIHQASIILYNQEHHFFCMKMDRQLLSVKIEKWIEFSGFPSTPSQQCVVFNGKKLESTECPRRPLSANNRPTLLLKLKHDNFSCRHSASHDYVHPMLCILYSDQ